MNDQSAIQIDLTRLVAVYLGKGVPAGSLGLELLTLGIVMLTNGEDFRQLAKETTSSDSPVQAGYSAIG
jgi:hypothetical protein